MAEPQQQADVSVGAIEADIDVTRQRLAATIDELAFRAQPKEIVRREIASIRASVHDATHTPEGDLRVERVAAVAAAAVALVALVIWRRRRG